MRAVATIMAVALCLPGCEPDDRPGGELLEIGVVLLEKNPGADGNYVLHVDERSRLRATGTYSSGRQEDITLALFWSLEPEGPAALNCQEDDLVGSWVLIEGLSPGLVELQAFTRGEQDQQIPCSPTPDGGWDFRDAGPDWPVASQPLRIEVR